MKELKKLSKRELSRIRATQQISHQIGYMFNIILRKYPNNERYKGRTQLRLILDNIDKRLSIYECKLNHNGGAIVGFYNDLPQYMDKSIGHIKIDYVNDHKSTLSFRNMEDYNLRYSIRILNKVRNRLVNIYEFNKKELPRIDEYDQYELMYKDGNIHYMDSVYTKDEYRKYKYIHDHLKGSPKLQLFNPNFKFEEGVMKYNSGGQDVFYVDTKEKLIVGLYDPYTPCNKYTHKPKELNRIIRYINNLIDGGIA